MKQNIRSFAFAFAALMTMAFTFTSCEDEFIAQSLEGSWEGNMYQEYEYHGNYYAPDYTEVSFLTDPFRFKQGKGYWVDYFKGYTPWSSERIINHTTWSVRDGIITIYLAEDGIQFTISDYHLSDRYFTGELWGSDGSYGEFRLKHVSSPHWDEYEYGYDYGYGYGYGYGYYAKTRGGAPADSTATIERPVRVSH